MKTLPFLRSFALSAALVLVAGSAAAQEVQISDSARQHFKTGVAYLTDPDGARYEEAYAEFKAAYADSASWKILGNLGITAMKLERDGEAVDAFEKYLAGGGDQIDPAERAQMQRDLETTKAGVVWVTLTAVPPNAVVTDERRPLTGRPVTNRYDLAADGTLKIGVRRGAHKFTASLQGYEDATWEVNAEPGAEQQHAFKLELPKVAPPAGGTTPGGGGEPVAMERPISTPVIIGAVATGAFLVGGGVVGLMAAGKKSDYDDKNDGHHVDEANELKDSGETLNLVADICLGVGIAAGVVTAVLFVNRPEVPSSGPETAALAITPAIGPRGGGFVMSGAF